MYGARPLKRAIQQQLENPLAEAILAGRFGPGDSVRVDADPEGLHFLRRLRGPRRGAVDLCAAASGFRCGG